jgi:hypothetical protein
MHILLALAALTGVLTALAIAVFRRSEQRAKRLGYFDLTSGS